MDYIVIGDYLLLLPYLLIFFLFARRLSKKEEPALRMFMLNAFWLRMLGCLLYSMVTQYYYGYGDSLTFFNGSNFFTERISEDVSNIRYLFAPIEDIEAWFIASPTSDLNFAGYFSHPSGNMIMKISAILSYLSFNRFLIISLFFAFFSFMGQWKLFTVFDSVNKKKNRKLLAYAVLYSPSIWFWGSGLMKDSLSLGALGFITFIIYKYITQKSLALSDYIILIGLTIMTYTIKDYIIIILAISVLLAVIFVFIKRLKNIVYRIVVIILFSIFTFSLLALIDISSIINTMVETAFSQIEVYQNSYEVATDASDDSKGGFSIDAITPSLTGFILKAPSVIFSCLYRPFLWESGKIMMLFTSIESTILLCCSLFLLFKTRITGFFKIIFSDYDVFFCLTISLLFAAIIGFTTFNFGTMIRYKIIFLPFFYFLLVHIHTITRQRKLADADK